MYHYCPSLCSLCEGKEERKKLYTPLLFIIYGNKNHHAADLYFVSNRQFFVGFQGLRL